MRAPALPRGSLAALLALLAPLGVSAQEVTLSPLTTLETDGGEAVTALDVSVDGDRLLIGDEGGGMSVSDLGSGDVLLRAESGDGRIVFTAFLAADTAVAAVDDEGTILIQGLGETGDAVPEPTRLETGDPPRRVALDAARRYLAVATEASEIEIFDLPTQQRLGVIEADDAIDDLLYLGFDRPGRQLVAVTAGGRATAWNPATMEPLRRVELQGEDLHGSRSVVHAADADRGANVLVVALEEVALPRGGVRGRARPGDLEREDQLLVFDWHSGARITGVSYPDGVVDHLAVGPGNDHAAVARGRSVSLMDLRGGERGAGFTAPASVSRLAVSPDDDRLVAGSEDGTVSVWSMEYREPATVDDLADGEPGLSGRLQVLGDDAPAIDPDARVVMAILPFDDRTEGDRMSRMVPELLTTQLANLEHLTLVERLRIQDLLDELDLADRGITESRGVELGRMLNADLVLLGSVGGFGTTQTLSARILRVETGEVVSGRQVLCEECRASDLFEAIHLLGNTIAR